MPIDLLTKENIEYYYIAKLNESRTDIENNYKLVTIIESSGNKVISEVTGTSSLKKILPIFEKQPIEDRIGTPMPSPTMAAMYSFIFDSIKDD